jgi:hypothetical protein
LRRSIWSHWAGTQPPDLSVERILRSGMPLDWNQQERKFDFR